MQTTAPCSWGCSHALWGETPSRPQVNIVLCCSLRTSGNLYLEFGKQGHRWLKRKRLKGNEINPRGLPDRKVFKALWHVLRAKPLSHEAARTGAMPFRYFTLQCKAALCFSGAVCAASLLQLSLLLLAEKKRERLPFYVFMLSYMHV